MEQHAASAEQLVALLRAASARRETASTGANAQSSRSHAVYQLTLRNGGRLVRVRVRVSLAVYQLSLRNGGRRLLP